MLPYVQKQWLCKDVLQTDMWASLAQGLHCLQYKVLKGFFLAPRRVVSPWGIGMSRLTQQCQC